MHMTAVGMAAKVEGCRTVLHLNLFPRQAPFIFCSSCCT